MHSVKRVRTSAEQKAARRRKEAGEIKRYQALQGEVYSKYRPATSEQVNVKSGLEATAMFLGVNPEDYTGWNIRRELILRLDEDLREIILSQELPFLDKLMVRFPKVYWIWNHRLWVLDQFSQLNGGKTKIPLEREMMLINKLLDKDARNFHGWAYRRFIVAKSPLPKVQVAQDEIAFTTTKINSNFSNFSAWHNRTQLIRKLPTDQRPSLDKELAYIHEALLMDPEDQSVWIYYRWLLFGDVYQEAAKPKLRDELEIIEDLSNEEESTWCLYTLWLLYKRVNGEHHNDIVEKLIELDPLRAERYKEMRQ